MARKNLDKTDKPPVTRTTAKPADAGNAPGQNGGLQSREPGKNPGATQPLRATALSSPGLSPRTDLPKPGTSAAMTLSEASSAPALPALKTPAKTPAPTSPAKAIKPGEADMPTRQSTSAGHQTIGVTFALIQSGAKRVCVCGDFNGWKPDATPMKQRGAGRWETTVALAPGRYEYKFVADGQWIHDPTAPQNVPNIHGSLNSVREVRI